MHPLRTQLVETALQWQSLFGCAPAITHTLSEFDAALLVGHTAESYGISVAGQSAVFRGYDFLFNDIRYQIKANRPSSLPGSRVTLIGKARNYHWDKLIWILYNPHYEMQEAWEWDVADYEEEFDTRARLSPNDMRKGRCLFKHSDPGMPSYQITSKKTSSKKLKIAPFSKHDWLDNMTNMPQHERQQILKDFLAEYGKKFDGNPRVISFQSRTIAFWERGRLYFFRDPIETRLNADNLFIIKMTPKQVKTKNPAGFIVMTRQEFELLFSNVIITKSWLKNGEYHYPTQPVRVIPFRILDP